MSADVNYTLFSLHEILASHSSVAKDLSLWDMTLCHSMLGATDPLIQHHILEDSKPSVFTTISQKKHKHITVQHCKTEMGHLIS